MRSLHEKGREQKSVLRCILMHRCICTKNLFVDKGTPLVPTLASLHLFPTTGSSRAPAGFLQVLPAACPRPLVFPLQGFCLSFGPSGWLAALSNQLPAGVANLNVSSIFV